MNKEEVQSLRKNSFRPWRLTTHTLEAIIIPYTQLEDIKKTALSTIWLKRYKGDPTRNIIPEESSNSFSNHLY